MADTANALEIAKYWQEWWKIGVSGLTPVAIAVLTFFITYTLNQQQSVLRKSEQILSEKQKTYSNIGEHLNIIFVYILDIGDFRHYDPMQIIEKKRAVDRLFFMYRPYWSDQTVKKYTDFMNAGFEMHGPDRGRSAKIRAITGEKKAAHAIDKKPWPENWNENFTHEIDPKVGIYYNDLVSSFLNDIATAAIYSNKQ
jgi:hypothetical protein